MIREKHEQAMNAAQEAFLAERSGHPRKAKRLLGLALTFETDAALAALQHNAPEPTRSVLLRSAATLALRAGDFRLAERHIARALAGEPPAAIADELRDLLETVHFSRHLELRNQQLEEDEVQMALSGKEVGAGIISSEEFLKRVEAVQKLIRRRVAYREKRPYSEARPSTGLINDFRLFVSTPRAASFAVTLKLGRSGSQRELDPTPAREVIDDVLDTLDAYEARDESRLKSMIRNEAYYKNFTGLAKLLAPNGKTVSQVGFTTTRKGTERFVSLRKPRIVDRPKGKGARKSDEAARTVKGILKCADAIRRGNEKISVVPTGHHAVTLYVPPGMMADIVKPLWDTEVVATYIVKKSNRMELLDITNADS